MKLNSNILCNSVVTLGNYLFRKFLSYSYLVYQKLHLVIEISRGTKAIKYINFIELLNVLQDF